MRMIVYYMIIIISANVILTLGYSTSSGSGSKYHSRYGNSSALKITSLKTSTSLTPLKQSSLFVLSSTKTIQTPPSPSPSLVPSIISKNMSKIKIIIPVVVALLSVITLGILHYHHRRMSSLLSSLS